MRLDSPAVSPETTEIFNQIAQLLSGMTDGGYISDRGVCQIRTTGIKRDTSSRTVFLKHNGLYDSIQLNIEGETFTLSAGSIGGQFDIDMSEQEEAALSALKTLLAALKTAQPSPEVSIATASLEDRVNQLLEKEGKPHYRDISGVAGQFYRRP